ncbi:MAG: hypothetical protein ABFS34_12245 [Gemmatimonadota bacterium]
MDEHREDALGDRQEEATAGAPVPLEAQQPSPPEAAQLPAAEPPAGEAESASPSQRASGAMRTFLTALLVFVLGLGIGFVPQWLKARGLSDDLGVARHELEVSRLQSTLGAALAEAERGNHERARQLTSAFYVGADEIEEVIVDDAQRDVIAGLLAERDEVITLLSRAAPEARGRLGVMYLRYFIAMEPLGREYGGSLAPSPDEGTPPAEPTGPAAGES